jgi:hypothetical protein
MVIVLPTNKTELDAIEDDHEGGDAGGVARMIVTGDKM